MRRTCSLPCRAQSPDCVEREREGAREEGRGGEGGEGGREGMRVGRERKDGAVSSGLDVLRPPEWLSSVPQSGRVSCCCPALHARPRKIWTFFSPSHIFFSSHRQKKNRGSHFYVARDSFRIRLGQKTSTWERKDEREQSPSIVVWQPCTGQCEKSSGRHYSNCYHVCMCACLHAVKTESCCVGGKKNKLHFPCLGLPIVSRHKASVNLLRVPVRCLE